MEVFFNLKIIEIVNGDLINEEYVLFKDINKALKFYKDVAKNIKQQYKFKNVNEDKTSYETYNDIEVDYVYVGINKREVL